MKKIVIVNNKGGVGKTTLASQLAFHLAGSGFSVVALDIDGQRNFTSVMHGQKVVGSALDMVTSGADGRGPARRSPPDRGGCRYSGECR